MILRVYWDSQERRGRGRERQVDVTLTYGCCGGALGRKIARKTLSSSQSGLLSECQASWSYIIRAYLKKISKYDLDSCLDGDRIMKNYIL